MSDDHARYRDDVAAYVLGALPEVESAALESHLHECEVCTRDLETFRGVVGTLSIPAAPQAARERLKQEMLGRVQVPESRGRVTRPRRRLFGGLASGRPALVGASLLVCGALVAGAYAVGSSGSGDSRQEFRATVDLASAPGVSATLMRTGDLGVLRTSGLPPLTSGVYVVWVDRGAGPRFASSFNVSGGRTADAGVAGLADVRRVMVTREKAAQVTRPTMSPILTVELQ